jgi:RNA polymerase sigma-70 factor (sigma-E family)
VDDDFATFVRMRMPALLRFGHALTGNRHDALDLVQSALERTGVRWRTVQRRGDDPEAYVRRTMVNTWVSRWRKLRRETLVAVVPDGPAAAVADAALEREPLWQALRALPPGQRAVIVLRYYEDLSEAQIADVLGVSPGTVKSQASKAMATLRVRLAERDPPDDAATLPAQTRSRT